MIKFQLSCLSGFVKEISLESLEKIKALIFHNDSGIIQIIDDICVKYNDENICVNHLYPKPRWNIHNKYIIDEEFLGYIIELINGEDND